MLSKARFTHALALALAVTTGSAVLLTATSADAQRAREGKKEKKGGSDSFDLSGDFRKAYVEADAALKAADLPGAKAKALALEATAQSPDEKFVLGQLLLAIGQQTSDNDLLKRALTLSIDSGKTPPDQVPQYNYFLGTFAYNEDDFPTAIRYFETAYELGYRQNDIELNLANAYLQSGDLDTGLAKLGELIQAKQAAGETAPESWYQLGLATAFNNSMSDQVGDWVLMKIKAFPTEQNWREGINIYRQTANLDDGANLDMLRLMYQAGVLDYSIDYNEFVQLADPRLFPVEVKQVLESGLAEGLTWEFNNYSTPANQRTQLEAYLRDQVQVATERSANEYFAELKSYETDAAKAADGKVALDAGDAYLGYGRNETAANYYRMALSKGGVDADLANTRLGIALVRNGDMAGAKAAFDQVNGSRKGIADFWSAWIDQKQG